MIAVFNSSPFIFLSGLDLADQSLGLFTDVCIPVNVHEEILRKSDKASDKLQALLTSNKIRVTETKNVRMIEALSRKLGRGESEAIVAAVEISADLIILDDRAARIEALSVGLAVRGTLGIIKRLMDLGMIRYELDKLYQDLSEMKFRVTKSIFNSVFTS